jgi:outer membrane receptor protein involved in Fe transport
VTLYNKPAKTSQSIIAVVSTTIALLPATAAIAAGIPGSSLEEIRITAQQREIMPPISASEGVVLTEQLQHRPVSRPAELLEFTPGLIATQHSGEGKANQYFLRGFNLDHGTDFSISVDGMPVNMRSHAHGQGYLDINFLIPELVESLAYRKGPYYAGVGDFSAAGSTDLYYRNSFDRPLLKLEIGEDNYYRGLAAGSINTGAGDLLIGLSYSAYDGPWDLSQDIGKFSGLLKYTHGDRDNGFSLTGMAYDNDWNSPDQIPQRAVDSSLITPLGSIDTGLGGASHRYSLSADWRREMNDNRWQATAYVIDYKLQLFSNFTYFLEDPVDGDQFEQFDDRTIYGVSGQFSHPLAIAAGNARMQYGFETSRDDIGTVGLYQTAARQRLATIREDSITENSYAGFIQADIPWTDRFRTILGGRVDHYTFNVNSDLPANSGKANDTIVSPKASVVLGPWNQTEFFFNIGKGFHSNDARGTTITVDPADPLEPAESVDPLVSAWGIDLGLRTTVIEDLQLAASIWGLELDSELLYVGDGGATEASGESRRYGFELGAVYTPTDWFIIDADYTWSHARFVDEPIDNRIPNAVSSVISVGMNVTDLDKWSGGLRLRHFGSSPLIEDNSVRAKSTTVLNGQVNYQLTDAMSVSLAGYNLLNSKDNDITYFYESRLFDEMDAVEDVHFHPVEPRTFRLFLSMQF